MQKLLLTFLIFIFNKRAFANPMMCTVCTVAVASGLGISRLLGVNDCIVGLWIGALLLAMGQYANIFLKKKNINNKFLNIFVYFVPFFSLIPLYIGKNPALKFNFDLICGVNSFLLSNIIGLAIIICSSKLYYYMKEKNGGKPHFPFEKVVLPITGLLLTSILFYIFKR